MKRHLHQARLADQRDVTVAAHDGDTVKLEFDRDFEYRAALALRLGGPSSARNRGVIGTGPQDVLAPELNEVGGPDCAVFVQAWLVERNRWPWPFMVETFKSRTNHEIATLGRYVAVVWAGEDEANTLNVAVRRFIAANGWTKGGEQ